MLIEQVVVETRRRLDSLDGHKEAATDLVGASMADLEALSNEVHARGSVVGAAGEAPGPAGDDPDC